MTWEDVRISCGTTDLEGSLLGPAGRVKGLVIFAQGGSSDRYSPRHRSMAGALAERGLATLLMDLLTENALSPYLRDRILGELQVLYAAG